MKKEKGKDKNKLIATEQKIMREAILSHPVFREMAVRLETIHSILKNLPIAIGKAVEEATRQAPQGASGPPVPVINAKKVEMEPRRLNVDGQAFELKPRNQE